MASYNRVTDTQFHFHCYSEEHLFHNINQIIGEQNPHTI